MTRASMKRLSLIRPLTKNEKGCSDSSDVEYTYLDEPTFGNVKLNRDDGSTAGPNDEDFSFCSQENDLKVQDGPTEVIETVKDTFVGDREISVKKARPKKIKI